MAKAKRNAGNSSMLSPIISGLKENILGVVGQMIKEKVRKMEQMVLELALSLVFFAMAVFFVLIALMFFLKEQYKFSYSLSFLSIGIIVFLVAFAIYKIANKE